MKILKKIKSSFVFGFIFGILLGDLPFACASPIRFSAQVNQQEITISQILFLNFTIESDLDLPEGTPEYTAEHFQVVSRQTSFSTQASYDSYHGKFSQIKSKTIRHHLSPLKTGRWKISNIRFQVGGQWLKAPDIEVSVIQEIQNPGQAYPQGQIAQGKSRELLFLQAEIRSPSSSFFKGEKLEVSYYLYSTVERVYRIQNEKHPVFSGFFKEDLENYFLNEQSIESEDVQCRGQPCRRILLARYALSPIREGELELDSLHVQVQYSSSSDEDHPLFGFFQNLTPQVLHLKSAPVKIQVKDLPRAGRPSSFSGGVGQFELTARLSAPEVKVNEAVTLFLEVRGKGSHLASIQAPSLSLSPTLEVYDSKGKTSKDSQSKVFEFLVIPRSGGDYEIPSIEMSFFDPIKKTYYSLSTSSLPLKVIGPISEPLDSNPAEIHPERPSQKNQVLGEEGLSLKPLKASPEKQTDLVHSSSFPPLWRILYVIFCVGLVVFLALLIRVYWRKFLTPRSNSQGQLKVFLHTALPSQPSWEELSAFYERLFLLWLNFLGEKTAWNGKGKTRQEQYEAWVTAGHFSEETWKNLEKIWEECDWIRFARGGGVSLEEACSRIPEVVRLSESLLAEWK